MLISAEHEIFHANKYQITNNCKFFLNIVKHEIFMLSQVELEHEKSFITYGPGPVLLTKSLDTLGFNTLRPRST